MKLLVIFGIVLFQLSLLISKSNGYRRVCYYTNWSQYRVGIGKYYPENVDPNLCTHLIYAFATLNKNQPRAFEWNDESTQWSKGMYERFQALKKINPSVKTLLAIGGWNMASQPFTNMVSSTAGMQEFASKTTQFLRRTGFDGLDLDWEYPAGRGSPPEDKQRYVQLLETVMRSFEEESRSTGRPRLLLTAAVPAGKDKVDAGFDVPVISRILDFISVMTYDLHGSWDDYTGHNSPLYPRSGETGHDRYLNMDWAARYWVSKGAPKEKLNIGIALYGRTFSLKNSADHLPGAAATGPGEAGPCTREGGFLAYYEICQLQKQVYEIPEQRVRYAVSGHEWIGYDDVQSIQEKVCYIKTSGFGGVMVWALDLDDFAGSCPGGKIYPLMNTIKDQLDSPESCTRFTRPSVSYPPIQTNSPYSPQQSVRPSTRQPFQFPTSRRPFPSQTTRAPHRPIYSSQPQAYSTTNMVNTISTTQEISCVGKKDDFYPHPTECTSYYICANSITFKVSCGPGLYYNRNTKYCDRSENVVCYQNVAAPIPVNRLPTKFSVAPQHINAQNDDEKPSSPHVTRPVAIGESTLQRIAGIQAVKNLCLKRRNGAVVPNTANCAQFYQCSYGVAFKMNCPPGTLFSHALLKCDFMYRVVC